MKQYTLFSTWMLKAYPFFARHIAERPIIGLSIAKINEESDRIRQQEGLTGRITGAMKTPVADQIWSALLGRPVESYYNPLRMFIPFADTYRSLSQVGDQAARDDSETGGLNTALNVAETILPSMNPIAGAAIRTLGLRGNDEPAQGYNRWAGPFKGLTAIAGINDGQGINLNAPFIKAEEGLRQALHGERPVNVEEAQVARKIDEMALRNTGQTIGSKSPVVAPYINAKASHKGPQWEAAAAEVAKETGLRSIAGFTSQALAPQALVGAEEKQIRQAKAGTLVKPETTTALAALAANPQTANTPLPPDHPIIQELRAATDTLTQQLGLPAPPAPALADLEAATPARLDTLRKEIFKAQARDNPLLTAYQGGGGSSESALGAQIAKNQNIHAILADDPVWQSLPPRAQENLLTAVQKNLALPPAQQVHSGALGMVTKYVEGRRDLNRKTQPELDQYLTYQQQQHGAGNVKDFLASQR
jgi:hypothetical protein